jgi:hypothetical protein
VQPWAAGNGYERHGSGTGAARERHGSGTGAARERHGSATGAPRERHGTATQLAFAVSGCVILIGGATGTAVTHIIRDNNLQ